MDTKDKTRSVKKKSEASEAKLTPEEKKKLITNFINSMRSAHEYRTN